MVFALRAVVRGLFAGLVVACLGCDTPRKLTPPTRLCVRELRDAPCRTPAEVEALLSRTDLQIVAATQPDFGRQGARTLTLLAPAAGGPIKFRAKWRAESTSHGLNDPRKEIAAHAVQKLLLDPVDFVVPPSTGHCFELDQYRRLVDAEEQATFEGSTCVFGSLSYWIEHGMNWLSALRHGGLRSERLIDEQQFERDATYKTSLADVNLLSYLTSNGDTHRQQFLFTGGSRSVRVYLVDFTIAFSDYRNPTLGPQHDWSLIQLPALSRRSVAKLAALRTDDFDRLAVFEQYAVRAGRLERIELRPLHGSRQQGLRWTGTGLQVGLTRAEIDLLLTRAAELLARVDLGEIRTF